MPQPKKPTRTGFTVRVENQHRDLIERAKAEAGYRSLSDYVLALLAHEVGFDVPAYVRTGTNPDQEELPISA